MELTLDKALQQAVAAHKESKLQEAERLYRAILQAQPNHPDANHNLGVLAVTIGKPLEAIPLFQLALETNPQIEQFWLSYLDVLIKLERFDEAKRVLIEGETFGFTSGRLRLFHQRIQTSPSEDEKNTKQGLTVSEKPKKLAEKKKSKKRKASSASSGAAPAQDLINHLLGHYQSGRFEEAEALAKSVTQKFPKHPFGWKVLGAVLKQTSRLSASLAPMQSAVKLSPQDAEAHNNLGITLQELGRLDESEESHRQAIALKPDYAEAHNNLGVALKKLGRLDEAIASYRQAIVLKPDFADACSNLGNMLQELGRLDESEASYRQAIALKPDSAEAHCNLGNTLEALGRLDESEASYRQAIALKPDYAETHNNLGVTLRELGRLDESEASYRQAIALKPDYAEAHNNLGVTLKELGRLEESISCYLRAINLKPDFDSAYSSLGVALQGAQFNKADPSLYPILTNLLNRGNFVRPKNVARPILSLIRLDNLIEEALLNTTTFTDIRDVDRVIKALARVPLLQQLMRICPLPDLKLEALFVSMRRMLLAGYGQTDSSPVLIHFLATLSLHCFTNEYLYFETEEETELISVLEAAIAERIAQASQPTITETLILASYRPLHQYYWIEKLQVLDQFPEVKVRLVEEPLVDRAIAQNIPALSSVNDGASRKVREQYEENPYPRWVKLAVAPRGRSVAEACNKFKLQLHTEKIKSVLSPSILIAGCGTGQHSIGTASSFANCKVTAVDLSCASLAYAQRKTNELGITNIEYLQADILHLGELDQDFDIIESSGVLHHMDDPMAGWRVLVGLLKIGGLMKIGLYSELARRPVVKTREDIAVKGMGTSEAEIRQFRQFLVESHEKHHQQLTGFGDFFSLSEVRDLVFHVQEHRFTALQIRGCLEELGLKFCGFESLDVVSKFKDFFGENADTCDLSLWQQFEERNPRTFLGMYQFWCQKI